MTLSVLAYTLFTGLCGLAPNLEWLFLFRFIASLGMGGEWSLGVSLVMEIWPNTLARLARRLDRRGSQRGLPADCRH